MRKPGNPKTLSTRILRQSRKRRKDSRRRRRNKMRMIPTRIMSKSSQLVKVEFVEIIFFLTGPKKMKISKTGPRYF